MEPDPLLSRLERSLWTVWCYITEAVSRFFRGDAAQADDVARLADFDETGEVADEEPGILEPSQPAVAWEAETQILVAVGEEGECEGLGECQVDRKGSEDIVNYAEPKEEEETEGRGDGGARSGVFDWLPINDTVRSFQAEEQGGESVPEGEEQHSKDVDIGCSSDWGHTGTATRPDDEEKGLQKDERMEEDPEKDGPQSARVWRQLEVCEEPHGIGRDGAEDAKEMVAEESKAVWSRDVIAVGGAYPKAERGKRSAVVESMRGREGNHRAATHPSPQLRGEEDGEDHRLISEEGPDQLMGGALKVASEGDEVKEKKRRSSSKGDEADLGISNRQTRRAQNGGSSSSGEEACPACPLRTCEGGIVVSQSPVVEAETPEEVPECNNGHELRENTAFGFPEGAEDREDAGSVGLLEGVETSSGGSILKDKLLAGQDGMDEDPLPQLEKDGDVEGLEVKTEESAPLMSLEDIRLPVETGAAETGGDKTSNVPEIQWPEGELIPTNGREDRMDRLEEVLLHGTEDLLIGYRRSGVVPDSTESDSEGVEMTAPEDGGVVMAEELSGSSGDTLIAPEGQDITESILSLDSEISPAEKEHRTSSLLGDITEYESARQPIETQLGKLMEVDKLDSKEDTLIGGPGRNESVMDMLDTQSRTSASEFEMSQAGEAGCPAETDEDMLSTWTQALQSEGVGEGTMDNKSEEFCRGPATLEEMPLSDEEEDVTPTQSSGEEEEDSMEAGDIEMSPQSESENPASSKDLSDVSQPPPGPTLSSIDGLVPDLEAGMLEVIDQATVELPREDNGGGQHASSGGAEFQKVCQPEMTVPSPTEGIMQNILEDMVPEPLTGVQCCSSDQELKLAESGTYHEMMQNTEHQSDAWLEKGVTPMTSSGGGEILLGDQLAERPAGLAGRLSPLAGEEAAEEEVESMDFCEVDQSMLDFTAQRARIAVKNPLVRPPKDPRTLLLMPSVEPQTSTHPPVKAPAAVPLGGLGMGIKLPGFGGGFPVLKKTQNPGNGTQQESEAKEDTNASDLKTVEAVAKPKWMPPGTPGFGNPLLSELATKLKKTTNE